jgi:predicted RNA-binding Zn-ribbon protein involved in translation (DUF1610 family)
MDGFTITCHDCQTQSEFENQQERFTEAIKVLIHYHGVRFVCTKCGQQLILI